uniref:Uncharacterized protein n=1 Tax=Brassica oleracea var. oleracea TaxID=109376 RepID=A0A0D3BGM9_BRAOL
MAFSLYKVAKSQVSNSKDEVDKGPTEPVPIDTDRIPSIDTNKPASIDTTTSPSIDTTASLSIDTDRIPSNDTNKPASIDAITSPSIDTVRILEHKEFDVCGNLRDGDTTMRSDKSGGMKKRNWKKRKGIKGDSQQRRRVYGGGFRTRMIKLQRVDIETCLEHVLILIRTKSISKVKQNDYNKALSGRQPTIRDTVASIDTVAKKSIDTVAENRELL